MPFYVRMLLASGPPEQVAEALPGHREQLAELQAAGRLRIAGELARGEGFVEIFETVDLREAEDLTRQSPLVEGGLVSWMLREWTEVELP